MPFWYSPMFFPRLFRDMRRASVILNSKFLPQNTSVTTSVAKY